MPKEWTPELLDMYKKPYNSGNLYGPPSPAPQSYYPGVITQEWLDAQDWYTPSQVPPQPAPKAGIPDWMKAIGDWGAGLSEWDFQDALGWLKAPGAVNFYDDVDEFEEKYLPGGTKVQPSLMPPKYAMAELGDTFESFGEKYKFDPTTLAQMNPDISTPKAGTAINLPGIGEGYSAPTPLPDPRVMLDTAATTPEGVQYPEGWNMAKLQAAIYGGGGVMDFASKFYGGDYTKQPGAKPPHPWESITMDYAASHPEEAQRMYEDYQASGVPTEELPQWPGLPSSHAWDKDPETGQWSKLPHGSVFDELYEMNGIDPNNPDMVEWFWGFADEDLLFAGELFDVLDWSTDEGGYGGYGSAPSPSSRSGRGQSPQRGDYASYLGLTSWSI